LTWCFEANNSHEEIDVMEPMEPTAYEVKRGVLQAELPVEPLFTRAEVCALVPCRLHALNKWLVRNKGRLDTPPYFYGPRNKSQRLLSASDVKTLRASFIRRFR